MKKLASIFLCLIGASQLVSSVVAAENRYVETVLVAGNASFHPQIVDPNMIDAWGIALRPPGAGGHIWVNNAHTGTSTEYIGDVAGVPLHQDGLKSVTLDTPRFTDHGYAFVTGLVYNSASDLAGQPIEFPVSGPADNYGTDPATPIAGGTSGAAKFIFVTEDGAINAWRANTAVGMVSAPVIIDYSKTAAAFPYQANCVFSGSALTTHAYTEPVYSSMGGNHFFAADFRNNAIEVFDNQWRDVTRTFHFQTPSDLGDFHVFNILDLAGHLFVAYAKFNSAGDEGMEEIDGPGLGRVVEYNEDGSLVREFADRGLLNAPWGMVIAPDGFGAFGGNLLVANFGDGTVSAFDLTTGAYIDSLKTAPGVPVSIDGIWGLTFGNGVSLGDANALYFTAGPNKEFDGVFGKLEFVPTPTTTPILPRWAMLVIVVGFACAALLHVKRLSAVDNSQP